MKTVLLVVFVLSVAASFLLGGASLAYNHVGERSLASATLSLMFVGHVVAVACMLLIANGWKRVP